MRNNKTVALLLGTIACLFIYGLWSLYDLRFARGDVYPPYSTLRPDPLGAKALYESLSALPGFTVARNFEPQEKLPKGAHSILLLGVDPHTFEDSGQEDLAALEKLANGGARVVLAMRPVRRMLETSFPTQPKAPKPDQSVIERRWGVKFEYQTHSLREFDENPDAMPKLTALYFRSGGKIVRRWERNFGAGSIALLSNCYPFSNEALENERDLEPIQWALANHASAIFDETHLGLEDSGSVVGLARKYHLEPLAAALLLLAALFVWRNSTSFLPPRTSDRGGDASVEARDAASALTNLLRRNIPVKKLARTCLAEWEKSRFGGHHYAGYRLHRIRVAVSEDNRPVEQVYREVSRILAERD